MIMAVRNEDDIHVIIMLLVKLMTDDNYNHTSGDQDRVDEDDDDQRVCEVNNDQIHCMSSHVKPDARQTRHWYKMTIMMNVMINVVNKVMIKAMVKVITVLVACAPM